MRGTLLALLITWSAILMASEPVTIGVIDYPPFYDSSGAGLISDIYRAAFAEVGINAAIVSVPIPRGRLMLLNHQIDALTAGSLFVEPEEQAQLLTVPVLNVLPSLFFYMPHFEDPGAIIEWQDLREYKIGVIVDSPLLNVYAQRGLNVVEIQTPKQLLMMAKRRRIDFFEATLLTGLYLIQRELPADQDKFDYLRWGVLEVSLSFHRDHPRADALRRQFEIGLGRIKEAGVFLQILEGYWGKGNVPQAVFIEQYPMQGIDQISDQVTREQYWAFPRDKSGRIIQTAP